MSESFAYSPAIFPPHIFFPPHSTPTPPSFSPPTSHLWGTEGPSSVQQWPSYLLSPDEKSLDTLMMSPYDCKDWRIRRKNASKECAGVLKVWLRDHQDNPYPTKREKIILGLMANMTFVQVSTWFANARRRLKKEGVTIQPQKPPGQPLKQRQSDQDNNSIVETTELMPMLSPNESQLLSPPMCHVPQPLVQQPQKQTKKIWSIVDVISS